MFHSLVCVVTFLARSVFVFFVACGANAAAQCVSQWLPGDGTPGLSGGASAAILWDPDGAGPAPEKLVVGGGFSGAGNVLASNIATLDLQTGAWAPIGTGMNGSVSALAKLPNGDLVAGGTFTQAGGVTTRGVARWDGSTWHALGSGMTAVSSMQVAALAVLPNGDLIAGGNFDTAGGVAASGIARWDGANWSALGSGMTGSFGALGNVISLAVMPNGDLIAGGSFTHAGGVLVRSVARWDGATWSPLGSGMDSGLPRVLALAVMPNGDLVAGGIFATAGGVPAIRVARWDGASWSALGGGVGSTPVFYSPPIVYVSALLPLPNGDLLVGGAFSVAGGLPASGCARWDGSNWSAVSNGGGGFVASTGAGVGSLCLLPGGDVVAGGGFSAVDGVATSGIARWNGSNWFPLGAGTNGEFRSLAVLPNGDVVCGGVFQTAGGVPVRNIARFNPLTRAWTALGLGMNDWVEALAATPNGDVIAAGRFTTAGGVPAQRVARWDGASWHPMGAGMDAQVLALAVLPNGAIVAAGEFSTADGAPANSIAIWNGTQWSELGTPNAGSLRALAVMPNGDLFVGGQFLNAAGGLASGLARWDGATWSIPFVVNGEVEALAVAPNGDLVMGGWFTTAGGVSALRLAIWDGTACRALGGGVTQGNLVRAVAVLPSGDVIAAGYFTAVGGVPADYIARWNGFSWSSIAGGLSYWVNDVGVLPNGDLVACGSFSLAGGVLSARFAQYRIPCETYCSAGISSNFCTAAMSASGAASASANSGYTLSASNVEGNRSGLIFYGLSGRDATLYAPTSSSLLCVKPPTQRTPPQNSGGSSGTCQGALSLDWNAFRASNPSALGNPFAAGQPVQAQAWFRDPTAPRGGNLSNAVEFIVAP